MKTYTVNVNPGDNAIRVLRAELALLPVSGWDIVRIERCNSGWNIYHR